MAIEQEGYGLVSKRLGVDSLPEIDHCCLTLQPARNPVITYVLFSLFSFFVNGVELAPLTKARPDGFLYDKEAILENIIHQKTTSK